MLLSLIDGYDIAAIAFAAPHLVREWGLKPGALGPVFSASLIGILFGSAVFGWIGDRYGRKTALIGSNLLFGVFTLAAAWSTNLDQLFWLRLLAGLGIGGVIPNVVAINTESAPRKLRATLALIGVGFVPLGGAIPGVVAATLVPTHGWQILFTIGGIVPIILALVAHIHPAGIDQISWRCTKASAPRWRKPSRRSIRTSKCRPMPNSSLRMNSNSRASTRLICSAMAFG